MADNEPTQQLVVGDSRSAVAWDIARFEAEFRALPGPANRRTAAVDRDQAGELLKRMAESITELAEGRQAAEDGKRAIDQDRRRLRTENLALRQRLSDAPTASLPAGAVAVMSGGQLQSEKIIDDARAEAARILSDANRILDDARLQAAATLTADEPVATGHRPTDFANMSAYVTSQLPVARRRVAGLERLQGDLLTEANARQADLDAWGEVLPMVRQQLAGDVVDVREVAS